VHAYFTPEERRRGTVDAGRVLSVGWDEALEAFAQSFYAQPKSLHLLRKQMVAAAGTRKPA